MARAIFVFARASVFGLSIGRAAASSHPRLRRRERSQPLAMTSSTSGRCQSISGVVWLLRFTLPGGFEGSEMRVVLPRGFSPRCCLGPHCAKFSLCLVLFVRSPSAVSSSSFPSPLASRPFWLLSSPSLCLFRFCHCISHSQPCSPPPLPPHRLPSPHVPHRVHAFFFKQRLTSRFPFTAHACRSSQSKYQIWVWWFVSFVY